MYLRDRRRFDELMWLKGLSQRKLAERVYVSQAFISLLASGQRGVRPETGWRIASVLGVYTDELFAPYPPSLRRAAPDETAGATVHQPPAPAACSARPEVPPTTGSVLAPGWRRARAVVRATFPGCQHTSHPAHHPSLPTTV